MVLVVKTEKGRGRDRRLGFHWAYRFRCRVALEEVDGESNVGVQGEY